MNRLISSLLHSVSEIRKHFHDKYWWKSRIEHRVIAPFQQQLYHDNGARVMDLDWDNLLILDACRADLFEEAVELDRFDDYRQVTSIGSSTPEWTQRNFQGDRFGDTVYVTGNPQISKYAGDSFHKVIEVWDDAFDESHKTVLPNEMVDAALQAHNQYPNKRLVVHFMQPHTPFVHRDEIFPPDHGVTDATLDESKEELKTMVDAVGLNSVWSAYKDNLLVAMDDVWTLLDELDGKSVVSSDHGELFGERAPPFFNRHYGHSTGIRHPDLVEVPWAVSDAASRRRIRVGDVSVTESDSDKIERQLKMLGYK